MKAVDAATMRDLDRRAIEEAGIPGAILMERAGAGLAFECALFASSLPARHARRFVILAGKGNNGGDAFVAARLLTTLKPDMEVRLHCACDVKGISGDAAAMFAKMPEKLKVSASFNLESDDLREGSIIIDGLLGTGFSGSLRKPFAEWISLVNASALPVVAIDLPSGLDADSGKVGETAIMADLTVTMALPKKGMLTGDGPLHCGRIKAIDIGIPRRFIDEAPDGTDVVMASDVRPLLTREGFATHKGERGHVLVIGGSRRYPGAPALSANAALKAGAGLVTLAIPEGANPHGPVHNAVIVRRIPNSGDGHFNDSSIPLIRELMAKADALVLGPGLSLDPGTSTIVQAVAGSGRPAVFDADALNLISEDPSLLEGMNPGCVLTPHVGEMRRLAKGFGIDCPADARERCAAALAARTKAHVILKGCRSIIAAPSGKLSVNGSGCPALATAGSGDSLAGILAAFLARGLDSFSAANAAVFIHGLAGELACPCGSRGLVADELPDFIAKAMREISPLS